MYGKRQIRICLLLFISALLVGCSEQVLYSKLTEREANEMVALLISSGLPASKANDKGDHFKIMIAKNGFADAVHLLHMNGLPREKYDNLGHVFAKEGFVSSPLEERARLNFALSQEIANTLSNVDGVLLARVHLAVPPRDDLNDTVEPASASVFIKHRSDVDLSGSTSLIKNIVVNGIENLSYDDVTVAFFKSSNSPLGVRPVNAVAIEPNKEMKLHLGLQPFFRHSNLALIIGFLALIIAVVSAWRIKAAHASASNRKSAQRSGGTEQ